MRSNRTPRLHTIGGWILALFTLLIQSGAAAEPGASSTAPAAPKAAELYRLRRGDEVAISVSPQKEYDCGGVILPDGVIYLKNVGPIKAIEMTVPELEKRIAEILEDELVEPRVRVALVRLAPFPPEPIKLVKPARITLVGAVARSGPMEIEPRLRLRKALDLAGGTSAGADLTRVVVLHPDLSRVVVDLSTPERVTNPAINLELKDGDSVEVPLRPEQPAAVLNPVRIVGEVGKPGQFELKQGMTLEDLILQAGGPSPLADLERIELRRLQQKPRTVNLSEQQKLGLDGLVRLEPGDELMIPELKDTILLIGAVPNAGARQLTPGVKIRDVILDPTNVSVVGSSFQRLDETIIIRRGQKKPLKSDLLAVIKNADHKSNLELQAGDIVFIPPPNNKKRGILDYLSSLGNAVWSTRFLTGFGY
ncbi:MAG: SLBB domain-containing protein [Actinomycetota bacterium]